MGSLALVVLGVVIVLGFVTALWLVVLNQNQPSFSFMRTEEIKFLSVAFPSNSSVVISVKNTGTSRLTIAGVKINNTAKTPTYGFYIETDGTLPIGASGTITISNWIWTNGYKYEFAVLAAAGNRYPYITTAVLGGFIPSPEPGHDPNPVDYSPLIVPSLIEIILIMAFAGAIVLNRKQYLHIPAPALAVLGMLMILGFLVVLWLAFFVPLPRQSFT